MGAKGTKEKPSEAKRAACAANAKQPRTRLPIELRAELVAAKAKLLRAILGPGFKRIERIIASPKSEPALFEWAMGFAADRAGLPRLTEQNVSVTGFAVHVNPTLADGDGVETGEGAGVMGLGWPTGSRDAVAGGGVDDQHAGLNGNSRAH